MHDPTGRNQVASFGIGLDTADQTLTMPSLVRHRGDLNQTSYASQDAWRIKPKVTELNMDSPSGFPIRSGANFLIQRAAEAKESEQNRTPVPRPCRGFEEEEFQALDLRRKEIAASRARSIALQSQILRRKRETAKEKRTALAHDLALKKASISRSARRVIAPVTVWKTPLIPTVYNPPYTLSCGENPNDETALLHLRQKPEQAGPAIFLKLDSAHCPKGGHLFPQNLVNVNLLVQEIASTMAEMSLGQTKSPSQRRRELILVVPKAFAFGDTAPREIKRSEYTASFGYYRLDPQTVVEFLRQNLRDSEISLRELKELLLVVGLPIKTEEERKRYREVMAKEKVRTEKLEKLKRDRADSLRKQDEDRERRAAEQREMMAAAAAQREAEREIERKAKSQIGSVAASSTKRKKQRVIEPLLSEQISAEPGEVSSNSMPDIPATPNVKTVDYKPRKKTDLNSIAEVSQPAAVASITAPTPSGTTAAALSSPSVQDQASPLHSDNPPLPLREVPIPQGQNVDTVVPTSMPPEIEPIPLVSEEMPSLSSPENAPPATLPRPAEIGIEQPPPKPALRDNDTQTSPEPEQSLQQQKEAGQSRNDPETVRRDVSQDTEVEKTIPTSEDKRGTDRPLVREKTQPDLLDHNENSSIEPSASKTPKESNVGGSPEPLTSLDKPEPSESPMLAKTPEEPEADVQPTQLEIEPPKRSAAKGKKKVPTSRTKTNANTKVKAKKKPAAGPAAKGKPGKNAKAARKSVAEEVAESIEELPPETEREEEDPTQAQNEVAPAPEKKSTETKRKRQPVAAKANNRNGGIKRVPAVTTANTSRPARKGKIVKESEPEPEPVEDVVEPESDDAEQKVADPASSSKKADAETNDLAKESPKGVKKQAADPLPQKPNAGLMHSPSRSPRPAKSKSRLPVEKVANTSSKKPSAPISERKKAARSQQVPASIRITAPTKGDKSGDRNGEESPDSEQQQPHPLKFEPRAPLVRSTTMDIETSAKEGNNKLLPAKSVNGELLNDTVGDLGLERKSDSQSTKLLEPRVLHSKKASVALDSMMSSGLKKALAQGVLTQGMQVQGRGGLRRGSHVQPDMLGEEEKVVFKATFDDEDAIMQLQVEIARREEEMRKQQEMKKKVGAASPRKEATNMGAGLSLAILKRNLEMLKS